MIDLIGQYYPFAITGVAAIMFPPMFKNLLRSVDPIEQDEIRQGRKDWYLNEIPRD